MTNTRSSIYSTDLMDLREDVMEGVYWVLFSEKSFVFI